MAGTAPAWRLSDALAEARHPRHHWLTGATWQLLARADLIHGRRLARAVRWLWPDRPPRLQPGPRGGFVAAYSRREIVAVCLAVLRCDRLFPSAEIEALAAAALQAGEVAA